MPYFPSMLTRLRNGPHSTYHGPVAMPGHGLADGDPPRAKVDRGPWLRTKGTANHEHGGDQAGGTPARARDPDGRADRRGAPGDPAVRRRPLAAGHDGAADARRLGRDGDDDGPRWQRR